MKELKNLPLMLLKNLKGLCVILTGIVLLTSCDLKTYVDPKIASSSHTVFINAIADQSSYNFYIDGFRVSNQTLSFSYALPYIYVTAGTKTVDLVTRSGQSVISKDIVFKATNYYNIFAIAQDTTGEFVVLEDDPATIVDPPAGKAKVRFIHLSPDAPNIDLFMNGGATLFTDVAYKAHTDFILMDPAVYTLDFRETGTTTTKLTKKSMEIQAGRLYTVMALGIWNPTQSDPGLDMGLINGK